MILLARSTGTAGSPLVDLLVAEGAQVRAVAREAGAAYLPAGVEVVKADPSRLGTIASLLDGVTAVFLHPRDCAERR